MRRWAKKGDVVSMGQSKPLTVLRRRNGGPLGITYDLQPFGTSSKAAAIRDIQAWRCKVIPRPPIPPPPDLRTIEDVAWAAMARHPEDQNGQSSGKAGSEAGPTK